MTPEQNQLLIKAGDSLRAARLLLENQLPEFAVSRAYYTMFYLAEILLLQDNLTFSSHAAVISAFGRVLAKTGRVPRHFHRYLIEAQDKRTDADYSIQSNISSRIAQDIIKKAQEMLDFAHANLDGSSS